MTYLPSVWELYNGNKKSFFDGLVNKQKGNYNKNDGWVLKRYNSITWKK